MALEDFGTAYPEEAIKEHGKRLLEKYGVDACDAALKLEEANISDGTARSYKPQVRQIIAKLRDENPSPTEVLDVIADADKKPSTKNIMVVAMKKYYQQIGESHKGEKLHDLARDSGIAEIDFNREMEVEEWIRKEEVEQIEEHILPPKGSRWHEIDGPGQSYVISLEHKALVMTLFYTGARVGEICKRNKDDEALKVEDLYPQSDQIRLYRLKKQGKGYKRDMKVVPEKLWDVLEEYMDEYDINEGELFPFVKRTAQNRISEVGEAYEFSFGEFEHMESLTPHKLRHGRITDLANHSGLEEAGQYVEHSSTEITNAYRHLAAEQQRDILPEESDEESDFAERLMEELDADNLEEAMEKVEELQA